MSRPASGGKRPRKDRISEQEKTLARAAAEKAFPEASKEFIGKANGLIKFALALKELGELLVDLFFK